MTQTLARLNFFASGIILMGAVMSCIFLTQVAVWMVDTSPPFEMLRYTLPPVAPGMWTTLKAKVKRNLDRNCSVDFNRYFFDSNGERFDISTNQHMNASAVRELDNQRPGELLFQFQVPYTAAHGPATLVTSLDYVCNPLHTLHPIQIIMVNQMEIL